MAFASPCPGPDPDRRLRKLPNKRLRFPEQARELLEPLYSVAFRVSGTQVDTGIPGTLLHLDPRFSRDLGGNPGCPASQIHAGPGYTHGPGIAK